MIVGQQKSIDEIWQMVKDHKKVLVMGCNTCVAVCHQGGFKEAEIITSLLRIKAAQEDVDMDIKVSAIERQCEHEFFDPVIETVKKVEAVLSTACGIGVQYMAEKFEKTFLYPALNTTFLGAVDQPGHFSERCQACGNCLLGSTGGICPISRCAKRLQNGPCGGSTAGKCEIAKDVDCVWQLIVNRLDALGRLDDYEQLAPLKDWSKDRAGGPRSFVIEGF